MPEYDNLETIIAAMERFNKRVYNAGYSFKVYDIGEDYVYVMGSFDFAYYVNVHMEFREMLYTSLKEGDRWPDAWHADQVFLLTEDEVKELFNREKISCTITEKLFGFQFNIPGSEVTGIIICKKLYIQWEFPAYED